MDVGMPEKAVANDGYAIQYSESGKASRKDLPTEAMALLFDILDALAANPEAFPGRVRPISLDGRVRLYSHPSPPLQIKRSRYRSPRSISLALRGAEATGHKACIYKLQPQGREMAGEAQTVLAAA